MKRIISGSILLISSTILYGFVHLCATNYMPNIHGWSTPPGRFGTAIQETNGTFPIILCILFALAGLILIVSELIANRNS